MNDKEDSPSPARPRNRGFKNQRARTISKSDRSLSRGQLSRSRSLSFDKRKSYRSRSRSPRYKKRKSRYEQSADSADSGRAGKYKRERNFSLNKDLSIRSRSCSHTRPVKSCPSCRNSQADLSGDSSPEDNVSTMDAPKCDHNQPFNPNCRACLSDKRHRSILARYNKKMKKFKQQTLLDINARGKWHPLKRCSRSHSREYQMICRTCKRLGALCLYPAWTYEPKPNSGGLHDDQDGSDDDGSHSSSMLIAAADMHDTMRDVVLLREGAESVFYEFPVNRKGGKKRGSTYIMCDCDECALSDIDTAPIVEAKGGSYTREPRRPSYGRGNNNNTTTRESRRRCSTEESPRYEDGEDYPPVYKRDRSPSYDYRYDRADDYEYEGDPYHHSHSNEPATEYSSSRRRETMDHHHNQYREKPHYKSDRGRPYGDRGRSYGDRGRSYSDRGRSYGDRGRSYGDRGRPYGDRGRSYGDCGRSYGDQRRLYGDRGRSYGGRGRGRGPRRGNSYRRDTFDEKKMFRQDHTDRYTSSREDPSTSRCIGVFGLSLHTEERDLREVFDRYGAINEVKMVFDHYTGRSKGFAFIYFRSLADAIDAKEGAPGLVIDGHSVRVDFSITERAHTPTPGVYLGKVAGRARGRGGQRGSHYIRRSPSPDYHKKRRYSRSRSYSPRGY